MKKTMSNIEMDNAVGLLGDLKETGKLGYAIARNLRVIKEAATEYLTAKNEAIKKHGTADANGNYSARIVDVLEELKDISGIEHDVEIFQVDEDTFCGGGLTSQQMEALLWMVKDNED